MGVMTIREMEVRCGHSLCVDELPNLGERKLGQASPSFTLDVYGGLFERPEHARNPLSSHASIWRAVSVAMGSRFLREA